MSGAVLPTVICTDCSADFPAASVTRRRALY